VNGPGKLRTGETAPTDDLRQNPPGAQGVVEAPEKASAAVRFAGLPQKPQPAWGCGRLAAQVFHHGFGAQADLEFFVDVMAMFADGLGVDAQLLTGGMTYCGEEKKSCGASPGLKTQGSPTIVL
jgi:hypothetical protein